MQGAYLLLHFEEEAYGRRFLRFLSGKKHAFLHPELVTDRHQLAGRIRLSSEKTVILTDSVDVYEDEGERAILLAGEQNRNQQKIFQYQSAEAIYEELLIQTGLQTLAQRFVPEQDEKSGVLLLFSLDGCGVTATAVMLSQYLGKRGKCLYLSLSGFPVYYSGEFVKEPDFLKPGLADLLFCSGEEAFASRLPSAIQEFGNADLLSPPPHFKDLFDCSKDDWRQLFERLQCQGGYDSVVIEIGQLFESVMDLLDLGEKVMIFSQNNAFGKVRREVFRQYCRMEGRDSLLDRVQFHVPPEAVTEWESGLPQQSLTEWSANSPIMQEMESLCTEDREEEEHVCIWEDFA